MPSSLLCSGEDGWWRNAKEAKLRLALLRARRCWVQLEEAELIHGLKIRIRADYGQLPVLYVLI